MSLISPGSYLRSKLTASEYDVRSEKDGNRIFSVKAQEAASLISTGLLFGKVTASGRLEYLISSVPAAKLRATLAKSGGDVKNAEDNKTTFLDGRSYAFHMRRVAAWAR